MNIETNEQLVRRNARIGQISMIGGLAVLVAGMILSIRATSLFGLSLVALVLGFALSQIGIFYGNRWGRRPRPDEMLNVALKGLDGKYSIYHYLTPASHLLIGPAGIWIILPKTQRGTITFERGRWRQRGGGLMMTYLKFFAQEGIGRPDLEILNEVESVEKYLKKLTENEEIPLIKAALVFTNEKANIQIGEDDNPPAATLPLNKLKDFFRKAAKGKSISFDKIQQIQSLISGIDVERAAPS
jgi:hypothetical protein